MSKPGPKKERKSRLKTAEIRARVPMEMKEAVLDLMEESGESESFIVREAVRMYLRLKSEEGVAKGRETPPQQFAAEEPESNSKGSERPNKGVIYRTRRVLRGALPAEGTALRT